MANTNTENLKNLLTQLTAKILSTCIDPLVRVMKLKFANLDVSNEMLNVNTPYLSFYYQNFFKYEY